MNRVKIDCNKIHDWDSFCIIEWVGPANIRRLIKEAQEGRIDAILVFAKNPDRLKKFDFPDYNYTQMIAGLAFRKDHPIDKLTSVEDLKNTVIGFHVDAIVPPVMRVDFIKWKWNYKPNWKEQNFAMVIRKRIDAAFDAMSISYDDIVKKYMKHQHNL